VLKHIDKFDLFKNINEVYQNSLIGITFIEKLGNVLVIKEPLLIDNYGNKNYLPENLNDVAVDKYYKLLRQLKNFNISKNITDELSRELMANIISYGFYSIIYFFEIKNLSTYEIIYSKIKSDVSMPYKLRFCAFIICLLLSSNKYLAKLGINSILFLKRKGTYNKMKKDLFSMIEKSEKKIHSTY
jgi:hypothetical protein